MAKLKKPQIVPLPTPSSTLGRTMSIEIGVLAKFEHFWKNAPKDHSAIWQTLSNHYINKPYLDIPWLFRGAYDIEHNGLTVYHRNHDVTHAVRQRLYAQNYLNIIETYGNAEYAPIAQKVKNNNEIQSCLELAIFLCRSGRTNEKSGREDPDNAKRSAELFDTVAAKLGFDPGLRNFLKFAIGTHAPKLDKHPDLINKLPGDNKRELAHLLKGVIDLSHHTDLVRCKTGSPREPVREQIEADLGEFLDPKKINIKRATTNLLVHATQACKMTGTRVKFETYSQHDQANNPQLKVKHTANVEGSFQQLKSIKLDLHKIVHEGPAGDFAEILRQVTLTGTLNLSNQTINPLQFEAIKQCIADSNIKHAFVLGTKPIEVQKQLIELLKAKSTKQAIPIEIDHTEGLEGDVVLDFDRQFRQQALDRQKISMRFEPSRLTAAWKNGFGAFFSQLWKEIIGDIPKFGGKTQFTQITAVKKLSNKALEDQYDKRKTAVDPLSGHLTKDLQTIETDNIKLEPGEMLLYHGTNSVASSLIMQNGFDDKRCKYTKLNGYGPLGKGIYFTSELSKAATFSTCSECGQSGQCSCVKKGTTQPADRVVLLCRVFVGKPEIILKKGDIRERTQPEATFDSCVALGHELEPISEFRSTEVCVPKSNQVIPLYEIRFSSQPNLLMASEWQSTMEQNGLYANVPKLKYSSKFLLELQQFRDIPAPFETIKNKAKKIETLIDTVITALSQGQNKEQQDTLAIQLRDLNNLKGQLSTLQKQSSDITPSKKTERTTTERLPSSLGMRMLRFFLPDEYALKMQCTELATEMHKNPGKPRDFLMEMNHWLNLAIERDQRKGTTFNLYGQSPYTKHRTLITQKMINLRDSLRELQDRDLSNEALSKATHHLIDKAVTELKAYGVLEPKIGKSTSLANLSAFLETASQLKDKHSVLVNPILRDLGPKESPAPLATKEVQPNAVIPLPTNAVKKENVAVASPPVTEKAEQEAPPSSLHLG